MIERELYLKRIRPFIDTDMVKVMTGMRRSGKSIMLELIKGELLKRGVKPCQLVSLNFEDMCYIPLLTAATLYNELIKRAQSFSGKAYFFLDEIQEVKDWEKCVNSLRVAIDCDIYITGSNAKLLSGELATYLAGRYIEFEIFPFSFAEFIDLYRSSAPNADNAECFKAYLTFGGMPYLANLNWQKEACNQYLHDLFSSVVIKDIVKRGNIRDVDLLERIVFYSINHVGMPFSAASIVKFLKSEHRKVSTETVINYLRYCCESFLFHRVKREDLPGKQLLSVNEKYYVADHGIRQAMCGNNMQDINQILENIVCMELLRRGFSVTVGKMGAKEIDFAATKDGKKIYVQVAYMLASDDTIEREFGVLLEVADNFPKYVISLDEFDMSRDGVIHKNAIDFLLMDDWT